MIDSTFIRARSEAAREIFRGYFEPFILAAWRAVPNIDGSRMESGPVRLCDGKMILRFPDETDPADVPEESAQEARALLDRFYETTDNDLFNDIWEYAKLHRVIRSSPVKGVYVQPSIW